MKVNLFYIMLLFIFLNLRAFIVMRKDKMIAIRNGNTNMGGEGRIQETSLFLTALCMGFLGVGLAMLLPTRHKKNKIYFRIGVPLIAVIDISLFVLLVDELQEDYHWVFYYSAQIVYDLMNWINSLIF